MDHIDPAQKVKPNTAERARRHAAAIAGDVLQARRSLDCDLLGEEDYAVALAAFASGVEGLPRVAAHLDRGLEARPAEAPADFADPVDGELSAGAASNPRHLPGGR